MDENFKTLHQETLQQLPRIVLGRVRSGRCKRITGDDAESKIKAYLRKVYGSDICYNFILWGKSVEEKLAYIKQMVYDYEPAIRDQFRQGYAELRSEINKCQNITNKK